VRWQSVTPEGAREIGLKFTGSTAALAGPLLGFAAS
jgi:hypothetical protein